MAFVPPQFSKFGKSTSDLFKKQFDFKNQVTSTTKASCGLKTEVNAVFAKDSVSSKIKSNYKTKDYDCELSLATAGDLSAKAVVPYKVHDNLKLTVTGTSKKADKAIDINAEFAQEFVVATASAKFNGSNTDLNAAAAIGSDGLSVGAAVKAAVDDKGAFDLKDHNFGINYAENDFNAALVTQKGGESVLVSFFQKVSGDAQIGAQYKYNMANNNSDITIGSALKLDNNTNFKVKANTAGEVSTAIQHDVKSTRVGVSAQFDATNLAFDAKKFGLSLSFGQF